MPAVQSRMEKLHAQHTNYITELTGNVTHDDASFNTTKISRLEYLGREAAKLTKVAKLASQRGILLDELDTIAALLQDDDHGCDVSVYKEFEEEVKDIQGRVEKLEAELTTEILHAADSETGLDVILEIRAGTVRFLYSVT